MSIFFGYFICIFIIFYFVICYIILFKDHYRSIFVILYDLSRSSEIPWRGSAFLQNRKCRKVPRSLFYPQDPILIRRYLATYADHRRFAFFLFLIYNRAYRSIERRRKLKKCKNFFQTVYLYRRTGHPSAGSHFRYKISPGCADAFQNEQKRRRSI